MEIKILGPGCPNCEELKRRTTQALNELGMEAEIQKVTDIMEIMKFTMSTPGLVVNGKLKHSGKPLPSVDRIKTLLHEGLS